MTTNVTRLLSAAGIPFEALDYAVDEEYLSGTHTAHALGLPPEQVFKTLVLTSDKNALICCVIPSSEEIDLKKAARAFGIKNCALLPMKDLLNATGYVRGGCSPIGMKKKLPTMIDETCQLFDRITISAGVRGTLILIDPADLIPYIDAQSADLTKT
ncbi:Cys-tRNA(Pro) deacylase [Eubacteriales bacterium OttesenSCG-928-N13]|nr:Cys-tRNA(Pro) deacylase [Eubacteriales bacterium OttesenSCG-928-N13]